MRLSCVHVDENTLRAFRQNSSRRERNCSQRETREFRKAPPCLSARSSPRGTGGGLGEKGESEKRSGSVGSRSEIHLRCGSLGLTSVSSASWRYCDLPPPIHGTLARAGDSALPDCRQQHHHPSHWSSETIRASAPPIGKVIHIPH